MIAERPRVSIEEALGQHVSFTKKPDERTYANCRCTLLTGSDVLGPTGPLRLGMYEVDHDLGRLNSRKAEEATVAGKKSSPSKENVCPKRMSAWTT